MRSTDLQARMRPHAYALVPGLALVALTLLWAVHDGGYDTETWYWGALVVLGLLAGSVVLQRDRLRVGRERAIVIGLFGAYVLWCYLSMAWAQSPGDALQGANQALLYLLLFSLMLTLPWTVEGAFVALAVFVGGVGVIAIVLMFDLASGYHIQSLVIEGRLSAPTGYFNSTAALFTIAALAGIGLAVRRELPGLLRGLLLAFAGVELQLALIVQSRGWLFTLPLVAVFTIAVVGDRLRYAAAAAIPIVSTLAIVHRLLDVYESNSAAALSRAAGSAGRPALLICAAALVLGTLIAWADSLRAAPPMPAPRRRLVGTALGAAVVIGCLAAGSALTHGHPLRFIARQWNGFSHQQTTYSSQSHFVDVGSGRYDFWRVALDAFLANPVGGLGEDNFADYYVVHRRTSEEPSWTHSLEMRLLAQTGLVGFFLFAAFMVCALVLAVRARRRGPPLTAALAGVALVPLVVWLIHGSIDWFWEMPALSGPALGFLALAIALSPPPVGGRAPVHGRAPVRGRAPAAAARPRRAPARGRSRPRRGLGLAGGVALVAGVIVLGLPYLSVREVSLGSDTAAVDPHVALDDLATAADLNPLSSDAGRLAGAVALQTGQYAVAEARFRQAISREPGGWFSWLGAGLAASAQGARERARVDFEAAYAINDQQPAIRLALRRVLTRDPLTSEQAFKLLVLIQ